MQLHFELRLEERQPDRVFVSAVLAPSDPEGAQVDGVSVQIHRRDGTALGKRLLLPISGRLDQPMITTVELRLLGAIPSSARVQGLAWHGTQQVAATCPCDPGTALGTHMRGRRLISLEDGSLEDGDSPLLMDLGPDQRAVFTRLYPWISEPMVPPEPTAVVESRATPSETAQETAAQAAEQYDLDPEDAAFLESLLGED